jgi:hypothetical protein
MFGRLLLCGGQSNMQFDFNSSFNGSEEVAAAAVYAHQIRLLMVARTASATMSEGPNLPKLVERWSMASPATVYDGKPFDIFSAESGWLASSWPPPCPRCRSG